MNNEIVALFIILPLVCEAITEIIGASALFEPVRKRIQKINNEFLNDLIACKYCLSVWVAALVSGLYCLGTGKSGLMFFFLVFLVHRLSNIYHNLGDIVYEYKRWRWIVGDK